MFSIILFVSIPFSFAKNGFVAPYEEITGETTIFLDILFVDANKFSSGTSDFFCFLYTGSFCKLTGTSRVKSVNYTVFSIMRVFFSIMRSNCFYLFVLTKVSSFYHSSNWGTTGSSFLVTLGGARCVCETSSCEQISSSIKLVFYAVVTDLGRPEPSFLFMMPDV